MLSFHPLEVTAVDRIAEDAICVRLAVPSELRGHFKHDAGQYVTVRRRIDGREERRTYSIVTPPGAAELRIGVREQTGGRMSRDLARLSPGERLEVGTPMGRFRTAVDASRVRAYVAFAAGSGITPVLSLAADILAREPASRFTLIYGNRSMARTMFLEDTLALKNRHLGRFAVYFVMSREPQHAPLMNGHIDAAKVEALAAQIADVARADEYFVCGPNDMVDAVRGAVERLNPGAPVRFERFATATASRRAAHGRPGRAPARRGAGADLGDHGRAPPQFSDGARGPLGARGGRARRARAAVLLPGRDLRDLPHQGQVGPRRDGAQHRARALGSRRGLYPVLPGSSSHRLAGADL